MNDSPTLLPMPACGILNVNKPPGVTSRYVVNGVERLARKMLAADSTGPRRGKAARPKVGHAGTLDPLATGVLIVALGDATRLIEYVQSAPKRYVGTFLLGRTSPTEDVQGDITELDNPPRPTREQLVEAARSLTGPIEQRPPAFSAKKIAGRRAYDLARAGREVELEPRRVTVHRIELVGYDYPELRLAIECGGGTYVRSLGRDLAASLGTGAVMSALVRTGIGPFTIEDAVDPARLTPKNLAEHLLPPLRAVQSLPRVALDANQVAAIRQGQWLRLDVDAAGAEPSELAAIDPAGRLVAIVVPRAGGRWGPSRNIGGAF
jgi:tRNA pseudouridine55 synthase